MVAIVVYFQRIKILYTVKRTCLQWIDIHRSQTSAMVWVLLELWLLLQPHLIGPSMVHVQAPVHAGHCRVYHPQPQERLDFEKTSRTWIALCFESFGRRLCPLSSLGDLHMLIRTRVSGLEMEICLWKVKLCLCIDASSQVYRVGFPNWQWCIAHRLSVCWLRMSNPHKFERCHLASRLGWWEKPLFFPLRSYMQCFHVVISC